LTEVDDIFTPLPDGLRSKADSLGPAPEGAYPDLPEWARTLVYRHSQMEIDLDELRPYAAESGDSGLTLAFEGTCLNLLEGGQAQVFTAGPKADDSGGWLRPRITDYWDASERSIEQAARQLAGLDERDRQAALAEVNASVNQHAAALTDQQLVLAAVNFADNLYKSACAIGWWDGDVSDYLEASAKTFSIALNERGFSFQYLVDNAWDDMSRPTRLLPGWYQASAVLFTCPQVLVSNLAEREPDSPALTTPGLIDEARGSCEEAVAACQQDGLNFVHLDADLVEGSFAQALADQGAEGVITMIRSEAPDPGTSINIIPPDGIELPGS